MENLEIVMPSEVSQTEKDKCHIILHVQSKNLVQMNLFTKQKKSHRCRKETYDYQEGTV